MKRTFILLRLSILLSSTALFSVGLLTGCSQSPAKKGPIPSSPVTTPASPSITQKISTPVPKPTIAAKTTIKPITTAKPAPTNIPIATVTTITKTQPKTTQAKVATKPTITTKTTIKPTTVKKPKPKLKPKTKTVTAKPKATPAPTKMTTAATTPDPTLEISDQLHLANQPLPQIALESLPLQFDNWTLDQKSILLDRQLHCVLSSNKLKLEDGAGGTPFYLQITDQGVVAVTKSNIDLKYPDTGLQIDTNSRIQVDRTISETAVVFEKNSSTLINQFRLGKLATVTLGFWPSWPMTQSYQAQIDLKSFPKAYQALLACNQL